MEPTPPKRSRDIKCFKCFGHEHITSECPNQSMITIREAQGEIESEDDEEEEDVKVELIENSYMEHADIEHLLVIRHSLNSQDKIEE